MFQDVGVTSCFDLQIFFSQAGLFLESVTVMIPADAARKTCIVSVSGNPLVELLRATDPFRKPGLLEGVSFCKTVVSAVKQHQDIFTLLSACFLSCVSSLRSHWDAEPQLTDGSLSHCCWCRGWSYSCLSAGGQEILIWVPNPCQQIVTYFYRVVFQLGLIPCSLHGSHCW